MSCILISELEILYVKWQLNVNTTTVLQETLYRVTDLYAGVVYISFPRDLADVHFKAKARYYTIQGTFNGTV